MNHPAVSSPRRRGAPSGNLNAVKHGFYSNRFKKAERTALEENEFEGLADEIALLRLYIRRVVTEGLQVDDLYYHLEVLRVLSLASSSLSRLVKIHALLASNGDPDLDALLTRAVAELNEEWEQEEQESQDYFRSVGSLAKSDLTSYPSFSMNASQQPSSMPHASFLPNDSE